jgi:hypothetical protein
MLCGNHVGHIESTQSRKQSDLLEPGIGLLVFEQPFEIDIGHTVNDWMLVSLSLV